MFESFENLEVWKRSCRLSVDTYRVLADCGDKGLYNQMTRASVSIPSNIAEGSERESDREFVRFLKISKGSAAELRTQFYIASKVGLLSTKTAMEFVLELKEISSMLHGLIKAKSPVT